MTVEAVRSAPEVLPAPKANSATVESRWLRLGPWYAMFPVEFAFETIQHYTAPGDRVLDPFMGRGTTIAAARALGRVGLGCEINPVAWLYAATKLDAGNKDVLLQRAQELHRLASSMKLKDVEGVPRTLPEFFRWAFHPEVLKFLAVARAELDWENDVNDRALMAIILVDLHGNQEKSFSNQMRQTKSMSPDYAVAWWQAKGLKPQKKDVVTMLHRKIEWRYKFGTIQSDRRTLALLGDSTELLKNMKLRSEQKYQLLLTSPPYYGIVNYNRDQWIRRWMLGGAWSNTTRGSHKHQRGFENKEQYRQLLLDVFENSRSLLRRDATIVVRTDARTFTLETTKSVLQEVFPQWDLQSNSRPCTDPTQTRLFGDTEKKPGEVDLILRR